jgi:hypothetical protein
MSWPPKRGSIPESCADLDLPTVGEELIRTMGNVRAAARAPMVPTSDLRRLVWAYPELMDAALEAGERALDAAEAAVVEAMRSGAMARRMRPADLLLRMSEAGRRRIER